MVLLYYAATFVFKIASTFANQKYARSLVSFFDLFIYAFITGCIASVFFFIMSGFCIRLNSVTLIYSAVFAVVVICSYFSSLPVYRYMGVAEAEVFSSTVSLTLSYISGMVLFDEKIDIRAIIRFSVMILCAVFMYLSSKKKVKSSETVSPKGVLLCFATAAVGVAATVISKSFAENSNVTDANSFFFMTNIFITLFSLIAVILINKGNVKGVLGTLRRQSAFSYSMIALSTVSANICSLLQILILAGDAINLYVPVTGAMGIIASALVALIAPRERPPIIPVILASAAFFI